MRPIPHIPMRTVRNKEKAPFSAISKIVDIRKMNYDMNKQFP